MTAFFSLFRKQFSETRWMLLLTTLALFGLSWLSVYRTHVFEDRIRAGTDARIARAQMFVRTIGGPNMDMSSLAIETLTLYWFFICMPLMLTIFWGISRGAGAVAGDLDRGSMDLILSRPVTRTSYFFSQVLVALTGFVLFLFAIVLGNLLATRVHHVETPASLSALLRPAVNLVMVGVAVFSYALFFSTIDNVRWRPILFASILTVAQFAALVIGNQPEWDDWKWLNKVTVFSTFQPIEAAMKARALPFNLAILAIVAAACMLPALIIFQQRDLPASAG
jgi:ABC-2 type transport system permease protein